MGGLQATMVGVAGYLLGSIPSGYLVARARGVDIRKVGSGNIGATNVFRILGKRAGAFVLLADALKGALAAWALPELAGWAMTAQPAVSPENLGLLAGIASILGHNYSCWLRFRGGKGIATTAGVLVALMPKALGIVLLLWLVTFGLSRYVSLASMIAAAALPLAVWLTGESAILVGVACLLSALAIYKHRGNIQRLRQGTEPRFGRPRNPPGLSV